MNYIIIETQTTNGVTAVVPPVVKNDYFEAEHQYHTMLAAAAISNVGIHAVSMFTERGTPVKDKHECYVHEQPEAEPEE